MVGINQVGNLLLMGLVKNQSLSTVVEVILSSLHALLTVVTLS